MRNFSWQLPSKIYFGNGESKNIVDRVNELGGSKVLLVTDKGLEQIGLPDQIKKLLSEASIEVEIFNEVKPDPTVEVVESGVKKAKETKSDILIGFGGGSSIDTAKAIGMLITNGGEVSDYWGNPPKNDPLPMIAIPTTAGTGSEVTFVTVIKDTKKKIKMGVGYSPQMAPNIALCDPELTVSAPSHITAFTGLDALTHAIEAYTNTKHDPVSDLFALKAIELIGKYLRLAVANGDNMEARYYMLLGNLMAGASFANKLLGVVHAITSPMGGYCDAPHGAVNAILLPYAMKFNYIGNPEKYADVAEAMGENVAGMTDLEAAQQSIEAVHQLSRDVNLPSGLSKVGVKEEDLEDISKAAISNVNISINPRKPSVEDLIAICKAAM